MNIQQIIINTSIKVLTELATNPNIKNNATELFRSAYDVYQMKIGKVNLQTVEEATKSAIETCIRDDKESQVRVAAFVSAMYSQHDIQRGAQVGGSLLKRFGTAWFPRIKERELRYSLNVDKELEDYLYSKIEQNVKL